MTRGSLRIPNLDPQSEVALALLREAATEVRPRYLGEAAAGLPWPGTPRSRNSRHLHAAWFEDVPVACGSLRERDQSIAEIQRMDVRREYRRSASMLMTAPVSATSGLS
jgi:hypothetical protein